jgi:hypothetical protein
LHVMCAKKLPSRDRPPASEGHRPDLSDEELSDTDVVRLLRSSMSWRSWIFNDLLRYFYAIGAFAFDVFIILEIARKYHVGDSAGVILVSLTLIFLLISEFLIYRRIWPQGILSGSEERVGKR